MTARSHCDCGEELWGPLERFGVCLGCQARERDERDEDAPPNHELDDE